MARVMLHSKNVLQRFWAEAVNTVVYVINRVYIRPNTNNTPYELWNGRKPTVKYFKTFGGKCYILKDREHLRKFDSRSDEGIFLGYSLNSKAYRVFHLKHSVFMESINVVVDDSGPPYFSDDEDDFSLTPTVSQQVEQEEKEEQQKKEPEDPTSLVQDPVVPHTDSESEAEFSGSKLNTSQSIQVHPRSQKSQVIKNHPLHKVIGDVYAPLKTRKQV